MTGISVVVQPSSVGVLQMDPVKPLAQMQRHCLLITTLVPPCPQALLDWQSERLGPLFLCCFGRTIRVIGIMTAAAISRSTIMRRRMNAHIGKPQHRRGLGLFEDWESYLTVWPLESADLPCGDGEGQPFAPLWWVGVEGEGDGKAARISEIEPDEPLAAFSFSFSSSFRFSRSSIPIRLAVLPRSRFEASFVARLMSSGRLVALPLGSFEPSKFKRGGRL